MPWESAWPGCGSDSSTPRPPGGSTAPFSPWWPHSGGSTHHLCVWTPRGSYGTLAARGTQTHTCWTTGWDCPCCTLTQSCSPSGWWSLSEADGSWCPRTLRDPDSHRASWAACGSRVASISCCCNPRCSHCWGRGALWGSAGSNHGPPRLKTYNSKQTFMCCL